TPSRSSNLPEILKIGRAVRRVVFMIARRRVDATNEPSPRAIEDSVVVGRSIGVGIVAKREHVSANHIHQPRRRIVPAAFDGDIARAHEYRGTAGGRIGGRW